MELRQLNIAQERASELILGGIHGAQARFDTARLEEATMEAAAESIQAGMRGQMGRGEAGRLQEVDDAAVVLQAGIRGKQGRREAFELGPGPAVKEKLSLLEAIRVRP